MDISLFLFSVAMFFQPVDLQTVKPVDQLHCDYLGVQYPVGQKLTIGTGGKITQKQCVPFKTEGALSHIVTWVEVKKS